MKEIGSAPTTSDKKLIIKISPFARQKREKQIREKISAYENEIDDDIEDDFDDDERESKKIFVSPTVIIRPSNAGNGAHPVIVSSENDPNQPKFTEMRLSVVSKNNSGEAFSEPVFLPATTKEDPDALEQKCRDQQKHRREKEEKDEGPQQQQQHVQEEEKDKEPAARKESDDSMDPLFDELSQGTLDWLASI